MYHVRRLAQGTKLHQAAAKLTKNEFKQLQEILQVVKKGRLQMLQRLKREHFP